MTEPSRNPCQLADDLPPLPEYVYGRECGENEKVVPLERVRAYGDARAAAAVAQERERCAKLCESMRPVMLPEPRPPNEDVERGYSAGMRRAADAIRAGS